MTILQQVSPTEGKPASSLRRPELPASLQEQMINQGEISLIDSILYQLHLQRDAARKADAIKQGQKISPKAAHNAQSEALEVLTDYLKQTGAPEEVLSIAQGCREISWAMYANSEKGGGSWINDFWAGEIGQWVPLVREAITSLKFLLKIGK